MKQQITQTLLLLLFSITLASAQKGYLGVYTDNVSSDKAKILNFDNRDGAYITKVVPGTPADQAGLQPLDYIVAIDDNELSWTRDLSDVLSKYRADQKATLHIIRKGKALKLPVTFGSGSRNYDTGRTYDDPFLGVSQNNHSDEDEKGVIVNIVRGSTADNMQLRDGDKIIAINGHTMVDWQDITAAINMIRPGQAVKIQYERVGNLRTAEGVMRTQTDTGRYSMSYTPEKERAFLGINSAKLSREKANALDIDNLYGSYVTGIIGNTAAEQGGLQPFDYVYGVDEYRVGENQSLTSILRKYDEDEKATIHFIRNGQNRSVQVTFGNRDEARDKHNSDCQEPFLGVQQSHSSNPRVGVLVNIVSNSTADRIGMEDDDIITEINGFRMIDWNDISTAIDNMTVGKTVEVRVIRDGQIRNLSGPIRSHCDKTEVTEERTMGFARSDSPIDVSDARVRLEDMPRDEVEEMNEEYNLDMPLVNNLSIQQIKLFPNPNMGMFRLEFELPRRGETLIRIFNTEGRQIYEYDLGNFSGDFSDDVDISQNGPGSYFLMIRQGNTALTKRIILTN